VTGSSNRARWLLYTLTTILAAMPVVGDGKAFETAEAKSMQQKDQWVTQHLLDAASQLPFSFIYEKKASAELLSGWTRTARTEKLDAGRTRHTLTWTDAKTGLEVRCVAVEYSDFPVVEWTLYFKNTGAKNTPILANIQGLDCAFQRGDGGEFVLHGIRGDINRPDSYQPYQLALKPSGKQQFAPSGGDGTCGAYPCYNLQMPGGGLIVAIGWPGQWASSFLRDKANGLRIVAGQQLTHLYLKPGEEVRSPLMVLLFWNGPDKVRGQNLWRRWMVRHNLPRSPDGKLPPTQYLSGYQGHIGFTAVTEQNQKEAIDLFVKRGIAPDYWNIDAGWFECGGDWWRSGTWEPDKLRFPNGLKPVGDHLHSKGIKFMTWYEPERVGDKNSWLAKNHPEWLIWEIWDSALLNLGIPAARQWVLEHIDKKTKEFGNDFYRQDFNIPPLDLWRKTDAADRQGITENLHIQGYLWWWDQLRRRQPNLRLDCCASGGRRNDIETLRRAVPVHRTDYVGEPTSQQCHHYGLSQWVPYHGAGYVVGKVVIPPPDNPPVDPPDKVDPYYFRSGMSPSFGLAVDVKRNDYDYRLLQRLIAQFRQVSPYYLCDFYQLTEYSLGHDVWMAWQYDNPEIGKGVVQVFRRPTNQQPSKTLRLFGLDPEARYKLTNFDSDVPIETTGKDLMEKGLTVEIKDKPGAAVIMYRRTAERP
jgi:alpha-galactosidase